LTSRSPGKALTDTERHFHPLADLWRKLQEKFSILTGSGILKNPEKLYGCVIPE
jgi:hypothetical protein